MFEERHPEGVKQNGGENKCGKRMKKGITLPGFDDPVGFKGSGENNTQDQDAKKQGNGKIMRQCDKCYERKDGKKENARNTFQDRSWFLFERVKKNPSPALPNRIERIVHSCAVDIHSEPADAAGARFFCFFH